MNLWTRVLNATNKMKDNGLENNSFNRSQTTTCNKMLLLTGSPIYWQITRTIIQYANPELFGYRVTK
jgi:hypothetical protein